MNRGLSTYLDALRLFAALGVVLTHARYFVLPGLPWALASHGGESVAVFFVLSGFVIRFASLEKDEATWKKYAAARLARIAPVAALSFASTFLFTLVATRNGSFAATQFTVGTPEDETFDLLKSVLFVNEVWFTHSVFGTNEPYWSLGFEVPYYLLFGLAAFLTGRRRVLAIVAWFALYGPKVAAFLPLWLLGVALYSVVRRQQVGPRRVAAGLALIAFAVSAFYCVHKFAQPEHASIFKPADYHEVLVAAGYHLLVGACFALSVLGANLALRDAGPDLSQVSDQVRWLAGGSFTLYLFHQPMMVAAYVLLPAMAHQPAIGWSVLLAVLVLCYGLAELAERRKRLARRWMAHLFSLEGKNTR